jgi:hypothetical protein
MLDSLRRIDASLVEEHGHLSQIPVRRDIYNQRDSIPYGVYDH